METVTCEAGKNCGQNIILWYISHLFVSPINSSCIGSAFTDPSDQWMWFLGR